VGADDAAAGGIDSIDERRRADMRSVSPKYVPREWMLVEAYEAAEAGDYGPIAELQRLFANPYDEQPEMEERFDRKTPEEMAARPGVAFFS